MEPVPGLGRSPCTSAHGDRAALTLGAVPVVLGAVPMVLGALSVVLAVDSCRWHG